jgi:hypothetical protein
MATRHKQGAPSREDARIQRSLDEALRGADSALLACKRLQRGGSVNPGRLEIACTELQRALRALAAVKSLGPLDETAAPAEPASSKGAFVPWSKVVADRKKKRTADRKKKREKAEKIEVARIPNRDRTS